MKSTAKNTNGMGWFEDLRVFVYGTLKPGGFYWPRFCEGKVEKWTAARVRGKIFDLPAGYPAACFGGDQWIEGTILELCDRKALEGFDYLEGFDPQNPESKENDYIRRRVEAFSTDPVLSVWVWGYEMKPDDIQRQGGRLVESGDWG